MTVALAEWHDDEATSAAAAPPALACRGGQAVLSPTLARRNTHGSLPPAASRSRRSMPAGCAIKAGIALRICYSATAHDRYHGEGENSRTVDGVTGMRSREDIADAVSTHGDTVLRVCTVYLREKADREDVFQETFLRYARHDGAFNGGEHVKAWLIRVAANLCKDLLKSSAYKTDSLDSLEDDVGLTPTGDDGQEGQRNLERGEVFDALRQLDERYRTALYLKYYEGYTAAQIAELTGTPENTVYTNLARGRTLLKGVLQHG